MRIPRAVQHLIEGFERLPGIGPKTAQRLTFYLLHVPQGELDKLAQALQNLRKDTVMCSICYGVGERNPCDVCIDIKRDKSAICVVEQPLDVLAIDKTGKFQGVYHVLHGKIDPLNSIGPDEIRISELIRRIKNSTKGTSPTRGLPTSRGRLFEAAQELRVKEVILATNPTMEGEATAMYIAKKLGELKSQDSNLKSLKVSRIGRGLPTGADLEYADLMTLERALEGRSSYGEVF